MWPLGPLSWPEVERGATAGNFIFAAASLSNQPASIMLFFTYSKRLAKRSALPSLNAGSYKPGERKIDAMTAACEFVNCSTLRLKYCCDAVMTP